MALERIIVLESDLLNSQKVIIMWKRLHSQGKTRFVLFVIFFLA